MSPELLVQLEQAALETASDGELCWPTLTEIACLNGPPWDRKYHMTCCSGFPRILKRNEVLLVAVLELLKQMNQFIGMMWWPDPGIWEVTFPNPGRRFTEDKDLLTAAVKAFLAVKDA